VKVLSVTSELYPLVKTGGLADVAGALPHALRTHGVAMRSLLPGYPVVMRALLHGETVHRYDSLLGGPARLVAGEAHGIDLLALDAPHLFDRPGNPYLGPDGRDWPDNAQRFAALARAAADIGQGKVAAFTPDLLHLHDWQAALAAVYVKFEGGPKTLVTVHNIAFQGQFPASIFALLGLPPEAFAIDGVEYYGTVSYLKGGLSLADAISTVSPSYAQEICTPEFGMGLDGLLRARQGVLHGIVNGIDTTVWNPVTDADLPENYAANRLAKRVANKRLLEQRFGLDTGDGIIHGVVSRLTWQKGMDILTACLDGMVASGARLAMIGTGEPGIESAVQAAAQRHKGRIGVVTAYDEKLSHLLQGGADTILIPSRFEPCGLTQLYGLRYGCVPVVARTGGLADTIIDANDAALGAGVATGFQFGPVEPAALESALTRSQRIYANPKAWASLQRRGMESDVSWDRSATVYADLYRSLVENIS
jgi:starch synthase